MLEYLWVIKDDFNIQKTKFYGLQIENKGQRSKRHSTRNEHIFQRALSKTVCNFLVRSRLYITSFFTRSQGFQWCSGLIIYFINTPFSLTTFSLLRKSKPLPDPVNFMGVQLVIRSISRFFFLQNSIKYSST